MEGEGLCQYQLIDEDMHEGISIIPGMSLSTHQVNCMHGGRQDSVNSHLTTGQRGYPPSSVTSGGAGRSGRNEATMDEGYAAR